MAQHSLTQPLVVHPGVTTTLVLCCRLLLTLTYSYVLSKLNMRAQTDKFKIPASGASMIIHFGVDHKLFQNHKGHMLE